LLDQVADRYQKRHAAANTLANVRAEPAQSKQVAKWNTMTTLASSKIVQSVCKNYLNSSTSGDRKIWLSLLIEDFTLEFANNHLFPGKRQPRGGLTRKKRKQRNFNVSEDDDNGDETGGGEEEEEELVPIVSEDEWHCARKLTLTYGAGNDFSDILLPPLPQNPYDEDAVDKAFNFTVSECIQDTSYGAHKQVYSDGTEVLLPSSIRNYDKEECWMR
jgi:hypothetical protein